MKVECDVNLTEKEVYNYVMYHTYSSFSGYIGLLLSICALFGMVYAWDALPWLHRGLLLLTGLLFTVIQPVMLWYKSKRQVKRNQAINKPLHYVFDESGIHISQGEQSARTGWEEITKVTNTKLNVIIYVTKIRAFVIPKSAVEGQYEELKSIIKKNAKAFYIKLR